MQLSLGNMNLGLVIIHMLQHMLTTFSSLNQVCSNDAGCCNVHARAHRSSEEGHRQARQGKSEEGPTSPSCSQGQPPPPFPPPCVPMNYVYVPRLCTTCVVMNHTMQPVLTSLSYMMDGCALPVAVRKEVSCSSISATCVPAHVAGLPLA